MGRKKVVSNTEPWLKDGQPVLEIVPEMYGFVYLITNKETGKKYVGKKAFHSYHTQIDHTLNERTGRMNKVKTKIASESNWKEYFGSNVEIKKDVKTYGKEAFTREILRYCKTNKELTYWEMSEQCKRDVLLDSNYINDNILGKFYRSDFK